MNTAVSIDVEMLEHLPAKTFLKLIEQRQRMQRHLQLQQQMLQALSSLFRQLEEWDIDIDFDLVYGDINLRFAGDGERFGRVWHELRRHGFKPHARPKKGDTSFNDRFKREGFARLWVSFSSTMCRRVQVGTRSKTVEEPIYETQCEGGLPEIEDQVPPALEHQGSDIAF